MGFRTAEREVLKTTERRRRLDQFTVSGFLLALPIFVSLNGSGIRLPDNHYEMSGIPLHLNVVALLLLLPYVKFTKAFYLLLVLFLTYLIISMFHTTERPLFAIQSAYFIMCYHFLNPRNHENLNSVVRGAVTSLYLFSVAHLASVIANSGGSLIEVFGQGGIFWGLSIYQSYLTYPLVLILGLLLYE